MFIFYFRLDGISFLFRNWFNSLLWFVYLLLGLLFLLLFFDSDIRSHKIKIVITFLGDRNLAATIMVDSAIVYVVSVAYRLANWLFQTRKKDLKFIGSDNEWGSWAIRSLLSFFQSCSHLDDWKLVISIREVFHWYPRLPDKGETITESGSEYIGNYCRNSSVSIELVDWTELSMICKITTSPANMQSMPSVVRWVFCIVIIIVQLIFRT